MGRPIQYTYYPLNVRFVGTNFGGTSLTAPGNTNTTWGWNVGQNTPPRFCGMSFNVEVARASVRWTTSPTSSAPNNVIGDCWMIGPFHGRFDAGLMKITQSIKATNSSTGQDGRFVYRLWHGSNPTGIGAELITGSYISSSIVTNATTTPLALTGSMNLPSFDLHNEYIFIHTQWSITGAATNNNADVNFVFGVTAANITLPTYISHPTTNVNLIQEEYPHSN